MREFIKIVEALDLPYPKRGARRFGIWLGQLDEERADNGIINYDYDDDIKGNALRYRLIVTSNYLAFIKQHLMPQIVEAGWHLTIETKRTRDRWQITFEPKIAPRLPKSATYWHVTPRANLLSILKDGLVPRESRYGFRYPQPRVYLIKNKNDAKTMIRSLSLRDKKPVDYIILRVNLRNVPGVKLHIDPELRNVAVYTTQAIPASAITVADSSPQID